MNNKLLIVCGPTATGKTDLALHLAEVLEGDIISADSRQVYKDMNIGTGKDVPTGSIWQLSDLPQPEYQLPIGYWQTDNVRIWGYDLVTPVEEYSVAQYVETANLILEKLSKENKLPILTGGTGLYIKAVVDGIQTSLIPKNNQLRVYFEEINADEMFEKLAQMDSLKAATLNSSDRKNPRRLIRAIEIAQWNLANHNKEIIKTKDWDTLFIGLTATKHQFEKNVKKRIEKRINEGLLDEIKKLLLMGVGWQFQSMNTLGYKEFKDYFEGSKSLQETISIWEMNENRYIKRQLTWFKKEKRIKWFDITKPGWKEDVEILVRKWYSSGNDTNIRIHPNAPNK